MEVSMQEELQEFHFCLQGIVPPRLPPPWSWYLNFNIKHEMWGWDFEVIYITEYQMILPLCVVNTMSNSEPHSIIKSQNKISDNLSNIISDLNN